MDVPRQTMTKSAAKCVTDQPEPKTAHRQRPRVRFRLRTLLLLPVVVAVLLRIAFPKLITGDFVEATIASINEQGDGVTIEMDARVSAGTGWGATNALHGGALVLGGQPQSRWTDVIPTWPKRMTILVNLRYNRANLWPKPNSLTELLVIEVGETYRVTPGEPLSIARARYINGKVGECRFESTRGSRLGL